MQLSNLATPLTRIALSTAIFIMAGPAAIAGDIQSDSGLSQQQMPVSTLHRPVLSPDIANRLHSPLGHHEAVMMSMLGRLHLDNGQLAQVKMIESRFLASEPSGQLPPHAVMQNHINNLLTVLTPQQRENLRVEILKVLRMNRSKPNSTPITTNTQMDNQ